jgi:predicted HTH transcriptional regulator
LNKSNRTELSGIDINNLVNYHQEERWLEFKQTMSWSDRASQARITKAIVAISNIKDGGWIVIGKEEQDNGTFVNTGMTKDHFDSYDSDQVKTVVNNYADPYALIDVDKREIDAKCYVIIRVKEFEEIPMICKRSYSGILNEGIIYTRSMGGRPESIPVPSQTEMREIVRIAVTKGVRRWFEQTKEIGIPLEGDKSRFERQMEDLL